MKLTKAMVKKITEQKKSNLIVSRDLIKPVNNKYIKTNYVLGSKGCCTGDHLVNTDRGFVKVKNLNRYKKIKILDNDVVCENLTNKVRKIENHSCICSDDLVMTERGPGKVCKLTSNFKVLGVDGRLFRLRKDK